MNNIFLYAPRDSQSYRQVEKYLANVSFGGECIIIPPGSRFSSPLCLHLRSNDIFILFAENDEDLTELCSSHEEYEDFRIVLIVKDEFQIQKSKLRNISPRFIAYLDSNVEDVQEYIHSAFKKNNEIL